MNISTCSSALTKTRKSSHIFSWVIENFQAEHLPTAETVGPIRIISPKFEVFHPDGVSVTSWSVDLTVDKTEITRANLTPHKWSANCLSTHGGVRCNFGIYAGTACNPTFYGWKETRNFCFHAANGGWGWPNWISVQTLREKGLLNADTLRIRAELTIHSQPESSITLTTGTENAAAATGSSLAFLEPVLNFDSLLKNLELSDIMIQCGSDQVFPAHKAILAGRSEVFKRMLTSDMAEVRSGIVKIADVTGRIFDIILRYIYTGKVEELDPDSLHDIIYAAEKYGLKELKNYCFHKLLTGISEENVGRLAVATYLYGADEMVKTAVKTFIKPRFALLVKNPDFINLLASYPHAFFNY